MLARGLNSLEDPALTRTECPPAPSGIQYRSTAAVRDVTEATIRVRSVQLGGWSLDGARAITAKS